MPPGTRAVALYASGEPELVAVAERLAMAGIPHHLVFEPDPPWSGALMAIGVVPTADRRPIRRALGHLPLVQQANGDTP